MPQQNPQRQPFYLFATLEEELAAPPEFWRSRTPEERLEYLEHVRCAVFGEEVVNAPMVRCWGWRKFGEEPDPRNIIYF